ncbi:MAG: hypothetical protein A2268_15305 [Candidatus Raymondbacteria bacterium RifOxyA12_full_50_37]|nr:MAG: hypothetical protein A2268_15305 [Candidatus Raymondbacteria bacterium RifOxyA12_full_50_37]OGK07934.1 MAG: hypothetical protein A2487_12580 [Candidatus Raymondbacteria bacterium RifOxyC12_full_50_8]
MYKKVFGLNLNTSLYPMLLGLKVGTNNDYYSDEIDRLYGEEAFDYIELFIVPGTFDRFVHLWKQKKIPYIFHGPHSLAGMNLSKVEHEANNHEKMREVDHFQRELNPQYTIFHAGLDGTLDEAIRQLKVFKSQYPELFASALVENKPKIGLHKEQCVGYSQEQIAQIMTQVGVGFCLDFGHAFAAAASLKKDEKAFVSDFMTLNPSMFHVSDSYSGKEMDSHLHLGLGNLDLTWILSLIPQAGLVTLETLKDTKDNLDDFVTDVRYVRNMLNSFCSKSA